MVMMKKIEMWIDIIADKNQSVATGCVIIKTKNR